MAQQAHLLVFILMAALLAPPEAEAQAGYYHALLQHLGEGLEVRDAGHGKGLFATRDFPARIVVFRERPMVRNTTWQQCGRLGSFGGCDDLITPDWLQSSHLLQLLLFIPLPPRWREMIQIGPK